MFWLKYRKSIEGTEKRLNIKELESFISNEDLESKRIGTADLFSLEAVRVRNKS